MKTAAIYLAAGTSRRMGTDKRSLFLNGVSLGSMALKNALLSELDHIFVITGKRDPLHWLRIFSFYPLCQISGARQNVSKRVRAKAILYNAVYKKRQSTS